MGETKEFPRLETDRLILRELTLDDADVIFPHFANEEVARYIDAKPAASIKDVTDIVNWGTNLLNNHTGTLWGIFRKEDGQFLEQVNYVVRPDNNFTGTVPVPKSDMN
ncbi:MAG: GNAT family N-acetyltransferase [Dehalococcoidales bacterium]|nr:MAG: GNAT family N-acetyltransferase [Dehalococcoidales bacterium]